MILRSALSAVSPTLSAVTLITWSPVSMCGAHTGLCLPRRTRATSVASRPSTMPSASTPCQARWISEAFGLYVGTRATFAAYGPGARGRPGSDGQAYGHGPRNGKPGPLPRVLPRVATWRAQDGHLAAYG